MKTKILNVLWCMMVLWCGTASAQDFSLAWAGGIGGASNDGIIGMKVDASGNTYTTGFFSGTVDFDPGVGVTNLTSNGGEDGFITKISPSGALLWARQIGGGGQDRIYTSAINSAGDIHITGFFNFTVDFDPTATIFNLSSNGDRDIFIVKLTSAGNFTWAKTIGGSFVDMGFGITVDNLDNVVVSGTFQDIADFDPNAGTNFLASNGDYDAFVVKLNSAGTFQWAINMGGANFDSAASVTVDANRDIYTTGIFQATADFDPSAGVSTLTSIAGNDIFINKINSNGTFNFVKQIGSVANDGVNIIVLDATNNIHTTGFFQGTVDLDPSAATSNVTSAGDDDVFVSKLDVNGNFVWGRNLGGSSIDRSSGLTVDAASNVYISGIFSGTADFNPDVAVSNLTSAGSFDGFMCKLNSTGNFSYAKSFGSTLVDVTGSVGVDASNAVYVAGYFNGTVDFNLDAAVFNLTSVGGNDVFIAKYIQCGINFNNVTGTNATVGVSYTLNGSATTLSGTLTYGVLPTLPAGLSLNTTTGIISGIPTTTTAISIYTVTASNGTCSNTQSYAFAVNCAGITISPTSGLPAGIIGTAYSQNITQTGLTGTPAWSISVGALPGGLAIAGATGIISGTPTTTGTFNFAVQASNGTCLQTQAYSVVVSCPTVTISPASGLPAGTVGTTYSQNITQTGLTGTPVWSVSVGALPGGVAIASATGVISGTPTVIGTFNFTVQVSDGTCLQTKAYSITVSCPIITISPASGLPAGTIGTTYSQNITQTGLTSTPVWSVSVGALPGGLAIASATGVISGTPTATGTFNFTVQASNGTCLQTKVYSIVVSCPTITFTNTTATSGIVGTAFNLNAGAIGNTSTLLYSVTPSLPAGLSLNTATGAISGTPTASALSTTYTVVATQTIACFASQTYTFAVTCPGIVISPASGLPAGTIGTTYSQNITQTGLTGTPVWSVSVGALPSGLAIASATGVISGTPTATGTFNFTVQASNGACLQTKVYSIVVSCPTITFTNTIATNGIVGTVFSLNAGVTGNTASLLYSVTPSLPAGLSLNTATGAISGTPTASALSTTYTVVATQTITCFASQTYTFAVTCPGIVISPASGLPAGTIGTAYSQNITQTGLTGTPVWSVSVGALPGGLAIAGATGVISGTPTATGTFNFTVQASNGTCLQTQAYSITVSCPIITFTNTTTSVGTVGTAFSLNAGATGNTATLLYSVTPSLPAGLSLNIATGSISGTPTASTLPTTYTVVATQTIACFASQTYTFAVNCAGFNITPATLPNGTATVAYNQILSTTLTGTIAWSVSPALPTGISLNTITGAISGTSAVIVASAAYTVTANNGTCNTSQIYNLGFATPCTLVILNPNLLALPNAIVGVAYELNITATGGTTNANYTFTTATPMPAGLTFANGIISGTPVLSTSVSFEVRATTLGGCSGTKVYTLVVLQNPTTAIDDALASQIKVFPNPSKDVFNIDFGNLNLGKSAIKIYDTQGKAIHSSEITGNEVSLSLGNMASGIYLMEINTTKGRITKRIVKE